MYAFEKIAISALCVFSVARLFSPVDSQTYCSLRLAVRDTSVCDATGSLEENVNSEIFQTKGNIEGMEDYQQETFKIFDQQVNNVLENVQTTTADVTGLEEEVTALKKVLSDLINGELMTTSGPPVRAKRASGVGTGTSGPAQIALDSAKLAFQQNVTDALSQLQNISRVLDNEMKRSAGEHAAMLQELSTNQQDLSLVEKQLQTVDKNIRQLAASKTTGGSGVSLTNVTKAVTQLVIDASVAENIAQRQYNYDEQALKQMEADEQKVDGDIKTVEARLNQADLDLNNETNQITTLQGSEKFNENQVKSFINTTNSQLATLTTAVNNAEASLTKVGNSLLSTTVNQNTLTKSLKTARQKVDGVQSLVTFTKKTQQKQLGDLLSIKRDVIDDLNVLKYAFGMITQVP